MRDRTRPARWLLLWALVALTALAGCTASELAPGAGLPAARGVAVLSVTRSGTRAFDLLLHLREAGGEPAGIVIVRADHRALDWAGAPGIGPTPPERPAGRLVVLSLAPGRYALARWSGDSDDGGWYGAGYYIRSAPLPLEFAVRAGEAVYLGNVQVDLPDYPSRDTLVGPGTYTLRVQDRRGRDLKVLAARHPALATNVVRTALLALPGGGTTMEHEFWQDNKHSDSGMLLRRRP